MRVPPKSMKQGIYWVSRYLNSERQRAKQSIPGAPSKSAQLEDAFVDLQMNFQKILADFVSPLVESGVSIATEDFDTLDSMMKKAGKQAERILGLSRRTEKSLQLQTHALLELAINAAVVNLKYGLIVGQKCVAWNPQTGILSVSGQPYMHFRFGTHINACDVSF